MFCRLLNPLLRQQQGSPQGLFPQSSTVSDSGDNQLKELVILVTVHRLFS